MKKVILCPLLVAVATMSFQMPAYSQEQAPAGAAIDLPPAIDPANVDDQKLNEIIETIRASRSAAVNTVFDRTMGSAGVLGATGLGLRAGEAGTDAIILKVANSKKANPATIKRLLGVSKKLGSASKYIFGITVLTLQVGIFLKIDELMYQPAKPGKDALMMQSGSNLDDLLKHSNQEIIAMANQDANLKNHLVNIYQAIMFINEPAAT